MKRIDIVFRLTLTALLIIFMLPFAACKGKETKDGTYLQISQEEAKRLMDTRDDIIILDVRTIEEFTEGHIEGAVSLDHEDIESKAKVVLPDKNKTILVYCRSGRRSKIAAQKLSEMGYTDVREFGGIIDWKYDIVK